MIKRLTVAVATLFALGMQAFAAGTIPYSLSQQLDEFGKPLSGGKLYLIQAGTTATPQNCYQDSALTLVLPNPITLDASGRLPQIFCADGSIKIRLTKSTGVNVVTVDGILVVGASSGGGGGSPVDPTTIIATGDVKARYGTGVLTGFVRLNGRTIGSASSGATERANADAQVLFEYLWNTDATLVVSSGRGVSSIADWTANKTIALPDARGRNMTGLDDMGNSPAGRITGISSPTPYTLGTGYGAESRIIAQANLPSLNWPNAMAIVNTLGLSDPGHTHTLNNAGNLTTGSSFGTGAGTTGGANVAVTANAAVTGISLTGGVSLSGQVSSGGSGTAITVLGPAILITIYMKL